MGILYTYVPSRVSAGRVLRGTIAAPRCGAAGSLCGGTRQQQPCQRQPSLHARFCILCRHG
ncbi:hypothetical protein IQ06DRAFT_86967 [Phaeosphaeriaceae sp. SRC1lsM3a]|nr:hypothetical protein IQ06DRAFT_86967 [Stagonospora sp. SRC1lsM3a]